MLAGLLATGGCDQEVVTDDFAAGSGPTLTVTRGAFEDRVLLTGEIEAAASIELSSPRTDVWDLAIRWLAEDGSEVRAGDRLVEFDNTSILDKIGDYELAVVQAGNELASQRATSATATEEKRFAREQARIEVAKAELDANTPADVLSRFEHQNFQVALERARVALGAAEDDYRAASSGGSLEEEVKRIAYDKAVRQLEAAETQLEALTLTAPSAGVMLVAEHPWEGRKFQVGDTAWPGLTIAKLPDLSKMVVEAALSDVDDGRIHVGMRAICTLDAFPKREIAGVVKAVSPVAREADRNSARRFFSVVVDLEETDPEIMRPGLSVKIVVLANRLDDALLAPRSALDLTTEPPSAHLADGGTVPVELGPCNAQVCVVASGLGEGDTLAAAAGGAE
jgi:HlyD family secretion protein